MRELALGCSMAIALFTTSCGAFVASGAPAPQAYSANEGQAPRVAGEPLPRSVPVEAAQLAQKGYVVVLVKPGQGSIVVGNDVAHAPSIGDAAIVAHAIAVPAPLPLALHARKARPLDEMNPYVRRPIRPIDEANPYRKGGVILPREPSPRGIDEANPYAPQEWRSPAS